MLLRNLAYFNLDWRSSRYRYKWCSFNNSEMSHSLWETDVWRVLTVEQDVKCVLDHYGCFFIKLGSLKVFRMWNWCALEKNLKKGVERKRAIEVVGNWLQRKMSPVSSCGQHFKHGHHSCEGRLGKPSSLFRTLSIELNLKRLGWGNKSWSGALRTFLYSHLETKSGPSEMVASQRLHLITSFSPHNNRMQWKLFPPTISEDY